MSHGTKLLALGVLILPTAALADPARDAIEATARAEDQAKADATARGPVIYADKLQADKLPKAVSQEEFGRWIGLTGPLTGVDGRPACGNVMTKAPSDCQEARWQAIAAREQAITAVVDTTVEQAAKQTKAKAKVKGKAKATAKR